MADAGNLGARLQGILDAYVAQGIIGVSLAVSVPGNEDILLASGLADRDKGSAMTPEHTFRIGSNTKTFVAAALHQLVAEGGVDLDEPISRWFPKLPKADALTVRLLLNHRSGLPDFENDIPIISERVWTPEELVEFAFEVGEQKEPGGEMEYSNTGYILAGMIIAKEAGEALSRRIRARLLEPLGLRDTWVGSDEAYPKERLARGYMHPDEGGNQLWDLSDVADSSGGPMDATEWFPLSGAGAAGDMISTPRDAVHWLKGLFGGRVLDQRGLWEMTGNLMPASFPGAPLTHNGHGVLVLTLGDDLVVKGHGGGIPGHVTWMGHDERSGITAALFQNSCASDTTSFHCAGIHVPYEAILRAAGA